MSYVKESEGYLRHMDELFREDSTDYDLAYREYQYLQEHNNPKPKEDVASTEERDKDI
jgi:hypothetical protein